MIADSIKALGGVGELELTQVREALLVAHEGKHRVYCAGNGGSASIASHFSADLCALGFDATCLCDAVPRVSALTNDAGWNKVYTEQMTHAKPGDVLVLFTVHGSVGAADAGPWSTNLKAAWLEAERRGMWVIVFSGNSGGFFKDTHVSLVAVESAEPYVVEGALGVLTHHVCAQLKAELVKLPTAKTPTPAAKPVPVAEVKLSDLFPEEPKK